MLMDNQSPQKGAPPVWNMGSAWHWGKTCHYAYNVQEGRKGFPTGRLHRRVNHDDSHFRGLDFFVELARL
jgi:hypothetical protein